MKKLLAVLLLTGASAFAAHFSFGVAVGGPVYYGPAPVAVYAPPPPPVYSYYRPVAPGPNYYWVGGYWYPSGPRYAWRAGYWARRPYAGAYWVGPRYSRGRYYGGYWRR
jgi:hypothetical protein